MRQQGCIPAHQDIKTLLDFVFYCEDKELELEGIAAIAARLLTPLSL